MTVRATVALALLLLAGATRADEALAPGTPFRTEAATLASPRAPGWQLDAQDDARVAFLLPEETRHTTATVRTVALPPAADGEAFFARAERYKTADLATHVTRSVHFNATQYRGGDCLRFDGLFQPPAREGDDGTRITLLGFLCPHPTNPDKAVEAVFRQEATTFGFASQGVADDFLRDWAPAIAHQP